MNHNVAFLSFIETYQKQSVTTMDTDYPAIFLYNYEVSTYNRTCGSRVASQRQPVVIAHIGDTERAIQGKAGIVVEACEIYAEFVLALSSQTVQVVVTEPKLSL